MIFSQLIDQLTRGPSWSAGREGNLVVSSAGNVVDISPTGAHTKSRMRKRARQTFLAASSTGSQYYWQEYYFPGQLYYDKFKADILNKSLK